MTDVLQSCSPCSVPVGFHQSPLHPCLVDCSQLRWSPVQHTMAQQGSLLPVRDVKDWQLSIDRGVSCARSTWFFMGHGQSGRSTSTPCLPALVRVIIIVTVIVPASLSTSTRIITSGPAYATAASGTGATATTCTGTAAAACTASAATCTGTAAGCWLLAWFAPTGTACTSSGLLAHFGPVYQLQTLTVRAVLVSIQLWKWHFLAMLQLEVRDELSYLICTLASLLKRFS